MSWWKTKAMHKGNFRFCLTKLFFQQVDIVPTSNSQDLNDRPYEVKQKPGKSDTLVYKCRLNVGWIFSFLVNKPLHALVLKGMLHNPMKNSVRNILLYKLKERNPYLSAVHFCITLSSKRIPSIFQLNNLTHYYYTVIFGMGIIKHFVAVHSQNYLYRFSTSVPASDFSSPCPTNFGSSEVFSTVVVY